MSHLSVMGDIFTIIFTYLGFALFIVGNLWNANIVEKCREIRHKYPSKTFYLTYYMYVTNFSTVYEKLVCRALCIPKEDGIPCCIPRISSYSGVYTKQGSSYFSNI